MLEKDNQKLLKALRKKITLKRWIRKFMSWIRPRTTPDIPQRKKTGLPAMERRIAASRNIVDGSLMDKE